MIMKPILLYVWLSLQGIIQLYGQGALIYDQQSSTNNSGDNVSMTAISAGQPVGQSFTPTFSSIDFVRFRFSVPRGPISFSATGTVFVNLWSGGISNGVLLAATAPVVVSLLFPNTVAYTNLFFDATVALNPGTTYYLQPFVQSEVGTLNIGIYQPPFYPATYAGGMAFINGRGLGAADLWFREGIIAVPEPSSGRLLFMASFFWLLLIGGKGGRLKPMHRQYRFTA